MITYLSRLSKNYNKYYSKIKRFFIHYSTLKYFYFKERHFNLLFNLNKHKKMFLLYDKKNKIKQSSYKFKPIKRYKSYRSLWYERFFYNFRLSKYSNIFIIFFLFLKKLILSLYINNTFSIYKEKIIIHSFKNNSFFLRNSFFQFDYVIKNFLNLEVNNFI